MESEVPNEANESHEPSAEDLAPAACDTCGLRVPRREILLKVRRSFSSRFKWVCPPCQAAMLHRVEAVVTGLQWALVPVLLVAGWWLGPAMQSLAFKMLGMMVGLLVGLVLHEAGHAGVAWLMGLRVWRVVIGSGRRIAKACWWGLGLEVRRLPTVGVVVIEPSTGRFAALRFGLAVAAGPAVNLILVVVAVWRLNGGGDSVPSPNLVGFIGFFAGANTWLLGVSLWPRLYGGALAGLPSDGLQLWRLLRDAGGEHRALAPSGVAATRVHEMLWRDDFEGALAAVAAAPMDAPNRVGLRINAAVAMISGGRFEDAYTLGQELLAEPDALEPATQAVLQNNTAWAGLLTHRAERLETMTGWVDLALETLPGHLALLATRGACAVVAGDLELAEELLRRSSIQDGDGTYRPIHVAWASVVAAVRGNDAEATALADSARKLKPESSEVEAVLAWGRMIEGKGSSSG